MKTLKTILFVDANIWLDFYRARTEAGLKLLAHLEQMRSRIIVTYQLEMEFKKNRQSAILEGLSELKPRPPLARPGLFSDAQAVAAIAKRHHEMEARLRKLRGRFARALADPAANDPVFQTCQRIFHRSDSLVLARDSKVRHIIFRKAWRRFLLGCPPRKKQDTSIGDAINWEWMVHCANLASAGLVIVSRDADFGVVHENVSYLNDHLRQEFAERVSKKRKIVLYNKLSAALEHFRVAVSDAEKTEEAAIAVQPVAADKSTPNLDELMRRLQESIAERRAELIAFLEAERKSQDAS